MPDDEKALAWRFRMKVQSYSDGTSASFQLSLYRSIVHIRTMPVNDCNPTKPKFRGNWVTANIQMEKTVQIIASHISKILFESFIVHLLSPCLRWIQKDYEQKILILNMDCKKDGKRRLRKPQKQVSIVRLWF